MKWHRALPLVLWSKTAQLPLYSLPLRIVFHLPVFLIPVTTHFSVFFFFQLISLPPLCHLDNLCPSFPSFSLLFQSVTWTNCCFKAFGFTLFPYSVLPSTCHYFLCHSISKSRAPSIISIPPVLLYPCSLLCICFLLSSQYTYIVSAMIPHSLSSSILSPTPLHLLPFTPCASDSVRQPLSAWLKSSGPTGGAKPWICFPSERLLFAHSGN